MRRWQNLVNPIWRRIGGGCHLNRDVVGLIEDGGFRIKNLETMYIPGWRPASYNYWGTAVLRGGCSVEILKTQFVSDSLVEQIIEGRKTASVVALDMVNVAEDAYNDPLIVGGTYDVYDSKLEPRVRIRITAMEVCRWDAIPERLWRGRRTRAPTSSGTTTSTTSTTRTTTSSSSRTTSRRSRVPRLEGLLVLVLCSAGIAVGEAPSYSPPDYPSPDDGGPRNFTVVVSTYLNLREGPSLKARVIARYAPGTVLDNLSGTTRGEGRFWCDVQELGGGPRGFAATDFLMAAVSPDGSVATGPDDSALRAGRGEFDATGTIPCAQSLGQPTAPCEFGVSRAGGGYATVVITRPNGRPRLIYFRMGIPIGADTSEADPGGRFSWTREGDLNLIRLGEERYEIPDAVVLGG